jgi:cobaltochelatase CobS
MTTHSIPAVTAQQALNGLTPVKMDFGLVFGGKANGTMINGYANPSAFTPKSDPDYMFHESCRDVALWFMSSPPEPLYVYGPTGAGKTSLIKNVACRLNYPVFEINAHSRLDFESLVGHLTYKNGNMQFQYGTLPLAMRYGGLLILNELDIADPAVLCGLNTVLDGSPLCITENDGELVTPHPLFRFVATGNSNGTSEDSGVYQGVLQQNAAFLDRFWFVEVDYPNAETELKLLEKLAPQLGTTILDRMINFANDVREQFRNQQIEVTCSTRTLIRWARLTLMFQPMAKQGKSPVLYAMQRALGYRGCPTTQKALEGMVERTFDKSMLNIPFKSATAAASQRQTSDWDFTRETLKELYQKFRSDAVGSRQYFDSYTPTVHLIHASVSGGKFWECKAYHDRIVMQWGANGTAGQQKEIPIAQCANGSTFWELMLRAEKKITADGYSLFMSKTMLHVPNNP